MPKGPSVLSFNFIIFMTFANRNAFSSSCFMLTLLSEKRHPATTPSYIPETLHFDDTDQNRQLQRLIVVHGDVAKTHHAFELIGKHGIDPTALCQQRENITRTLRHAQLFTPDSHSGWRPRTKLFVHPTPTSADRW